MIWAEFHCRGSQGAADSYGLLLEWLTFGNFLSSWKRISFDDLLNWLLSASNGSHCAPHHQSPHLLCKLLEPPLHCMFLSWNPPASAGGMGSMLGLGRSPGEGNVNSLQYSCLGNPMDREAWWTI